MWQWQYPMGAMQQPRRAVAQLRGGPLAPQLRGTVTFTEVAGGVWVAAVVSSKAD
jgi:Cu-Zn family superoxide dismutase